MAIALADYLTRIRIELQTAGVTEWTDADLEQALRDALVEYDDAAPYEAIEDVTLPDDSREIDLSGALDPLPVRITRVWLPWTAGEDESEHNPRVFELMPNFLLRIIGGDDLVAADHARIWYEAHNTIEDLDSAGSTSVPDFRSSTLIIGAAAFAAYQRVRDLAEIANVDGDVPQRLSSFGFNALNRFRSQLNNIRSTAAGGFVGLEPQRRWRVPRA